MKEFTIIYPYTNIGFPSQMANMIQTLNTCDSLAQTGLARVYLILRNASGWGPEKIREYYGLNANPAFEIHSIPLAHSRTRIVGKADNLLYRALLIRSVLGIAGRAHNVVIFSRDASMLSLLTRVPGLRGPTRFAYEAHNSIRVSLNHSQRWYGESRPVNSLKIRLYSSFERRAIRKASAVFVLTRRLAEILSSEYPGSCQKIVVAPDAARRIDMEPGPPPNNGHTSLVGYVGQLFPSRGVDVLVQAMPLLDKSVRLLIVGGSDNRKDIERLSNLARSLGVENRITFTGFVAPSRIGSFLSRPDVLVMPLVDDEVTRNFASSMKQFEYMAARKPIVASDLPSTREILRHKENAILVRPDSPESLAEGIAVALEDKELARKISETAYREVNEKYTFGKRAETIIAALEDLCR
ncbi:glycosyltransferase family 4 protein [Candidatus Poribacteria bacterium]|nr:glycosyltransferase family 4 protein [Candidatus Poribacteria bacterium]